MQLCGFVLRLFLGSSDLGGQSIILIHPGRRLPQHSLNARLRVTASKKLNSAVRLLVRLVHCLQCDNKPVVTIPSLNNVQDLTGDIKSTTDFIQATLNDTLSRKHDYPLRMFTKAIQKVCKLTLPFLKNFFLVAGSSSSVTSRSIDAKS